MTPIQHRILWGGLLGLVWLSVAEVAVGFVRPWALLDLKAHDLTAPLDRVAEGTPLAGAAGRPTKTLGRVVVNVKRGAETVTGELPDLSQMPRQVSGIEVPRLANRSDAKLVLALAEVLTGERELGAKSYAVYLLPGVALVCGALVTVLGRIRAVSLVIGTVCVAVAGLGWWKLSTTNTETLVVAITIGPGLWLSLWGYAGLGLSAIALAWAPRPRRSS